MSTGKIGLVPVGRYKTDPITISLTGATTLRIMGAGRGRTASSPTCAFVQRAAHANNDTALLKITGDTSGGVSVGQECEVIVEGIQVIGSGALGSGLLLHYISKRATVRNCYAYGFTTGRGIWFNQCIGVHGEGFNSAANHTGLEVSSTLSVSQGEGTFVSCKIEQNPTRNIYLKATFLSFISCQIYGVCSEASVVPEDNTYNIVFLNCSFESASRVLYVATGKTILDWIMEDNYFEAESTSGTKYCLDIAGGIVNSRIAFNNFTLQASAGCTIVPIRAVQDSRSLVWGPNRTNISGAGLLAFDATVWSKHYGSDATSIGGLTNAFPVLETPPSMVSRMNTLGPTLANNGVRTLDSYSNALIFLSTGVGPCLIATNGTTPAIVYGNVGTFSLVKDTASRVNFYFESGAHKIQNKAGAGIYVGVMAVAAI